MVLASLPIRSSLMLRACIGLMLIPAVVVAEEQRPFVLLLEDALPTHGEQRVPERRRVDLQWQGWLSRWSRLVDGTPVHGYAMAWDDAGNKWGYNSATHTGLLDAEVGPEAGDQDWSLTLEGALRRDLWGNGGGRVRVAVRLRAEGGSWLGEYTIRVQPGRPATSKNKKQPEGEPPPFLRTKRSPAQAPAAVEHRGIARLHWLPHRPAAWPEHEPPRPEEHPRLLLRREQLLVLKQRAASAFGRDVLARLDEQLAGQVTVDTAASQAVGWGLRYLLEDEPAHAERARQLVAGYLDGSLAADGTGGNRWNSREKRILRSHAVARVALAYDLCYRAWDPTFRRRVAMSLVQRAREMVDDQRRAEYNDTPSSNHFTLCNAAGALAALAVLGDPGGEDVAAVLAMAEHHLIRHATHPLSPGPLGISGEGDAYALYGQAQLWLWLRAARLVQGRDWLAAYSNMGDLRAWNARLLPVRGGQPLLPACGPYAWQYALRTPNNPYVLGLCVQNSADLPPATASYRRCFGPEGSGDWGVHRPHEALLALLGHDPDLPAPAPRGLVQLVDPDKGWYLLRRYAGTADAVDHLVGVYAKHANGGGWNFSEAGALRIISGRTVWSGRGAGGDGGTRGSGDWEAESTVTVTAANGWLGMRTVSHAAEAEGMRLLLDARRTLWERLPKQERDLVTASDVSPGFRDRGARGGRLVQVHGGLQATDLLVVIADRIKAADHEPVWRWQTRLPVTIRADGFSLQGAEGLEGRVRFLSPAEPQIILVDDQVTVKGGERFLAVFTLAREERHPPLRFDIEAEELQVGTEVVPLSLADLEALVDPDGE